MRNLCIAVPILLIAGSASADFVTGAVSVSGPAPLGGFEWENTIDQSGLTVGYVSDVTDFASYIASAPTHVGSNTPGNYAATFGTPRIVDYTLASATVVTQMAFWNYPFLTAGPVLEFDVYTATLPDFSDATFVGTYFPVSDGEDVGGPGDNDVQVFDLADTFAQYVRLDVQRIDPGSTGFGFSEIAFGTIPTPGTGALLGLAGLGVVRRRRR